MDIRRKKNFIFLNLIFTAVIIAGLTGCFGSGGEGEKQTGDGGSVNGYNVNLSRLEISAGVLSPVFNQSVTSYNVEVDNSIASIDITAEAADSSAVIMINGADHIVNKTVNLIVGHNTVTITLTAPDGVTVRNYYISINRLASFYSNNANLSGLSISNAVLSPLFSENQISYSAEVPYSVSSIIVTPTAAGVGASIKVNNNAVVSGTASGAVNLDEGVNNITVTVTAQNGKGFKTYTVAVTRLADTSHNANLAGLSISAGTLSPVFAVNTITYTAQVESSVSSITVTPTVEGADATVTVNGTQVASGSATQSITLSSGDNTITIIVTAKDGITAKTYTVTVTQALSTNANLAGLSLSTASLSPEFSVDTTSYSARVGSAVTSITVTPTVEGVGATVTVNGTPVISGTSSDSIELTAGDNIIAVVVTPQDGTAPVREYTINVIRLYPAMVLSATNGEYNDCIVVFFSDHGYHMNLYRSTSPDSGYTILPLTPYDQGQNQYYDRDVSSYPAGTKFYYKAEYTGGIGSGPSNSEMSNAACGYRASAFTVASNFYPESSLALVSEQFLLSNNGTLFIAYLESGKVYVKQYSSGSWQTIGSVGNSAWAYDIAFTIYNDTLYVAYRETTDSNSAPYTIYVKKYVSGSWQQIGSEVAGSTYNYNSGGHRDISLAVYNNEVYIAYTDVNKASVKKYDGYTWNYVGNSGFANVSLNISLQIVNGMPYVAFADSSNGNKVSVMRYNVSLWEQVGAAGFTSEPVRISELYKIDFKSDGSILYIAYVGDTTVKPIVMKYTSGWSQLGSSLNAYVPVPGYQYQGTSAYSLCICNSIPYIAYRHVNYGYEIVVSTFDGTAWNNLAITGCYNQNSYAGTGSIAMSLVCDNGKSYLAYSRGINSHFFYEIYQTE